MPPQHTAHHAEDLNLQQHRCDNLSACITYTTSRKNGKSWEVTALRLYGEEIWNSGIGPIFFLDKFVVVPVTQILSKP
jgi:hypothetical protein